MRPLAAALARAACSSCTFRGFAALDVPITLRVGEFDAATPREAEGASEDIMKFAKNASPLEIVAGACHALLCEDFDATVAAIAARV